MESRGVQDLTILQGYMCCCPADRSAGFGSFAPCNKCSTAGGVCKSHLASCSPHTRSRVQCWLRGWHPLARMCSALDLVLQDVSCALWLVWCGPKPGCLRAVAVQDPGGVRAGVPLHVHAQHADPADGGGPGAVRDARLHHLQRRRLPLQPVRLRTDPVNNGAVDRLARCPLF